MFHIAVKYILITALENERVLAWNVVNALEADMPQESNQVISEREYVIVLLWTWVHSETNISISGDKLPKRPHLINWKYSYVNINKI